MDKLKIAIICTKNQDSWIIGKFAEKLKENLLLLGFEANILETPSDKYDINHHVYHGDYMGCDNTISTFMITHIDTNPKLLRLIQLLEYCNLGICMSKNTADFLLKKGVVAYKITYIHPAHDSNFEFKKNRIGIFSNVYKDGRKNEEWLIDISNKISNQLFEFVFIGSGWETISNFLLDKGFTVTSLPFSRENYDRNIEIIDYWLYLGFDEGSMSFLDAIQCGKKIICSNQGFQNDMINSIDYPFNNKEELLNIFSRLNKINQSKYNYSLQLNWNNFTKKHIEVWNYLYNKKQINSSFEDGLNYLINLKKNKNNVSKLILKLNLIIHKTKKKIKYITSKIVE